MFANDSKTAITKALEVCQRIADGDFEARVINITETGPAGDMLHALNLLIDRTDAYIRESKASLEYVAQNKYFRRISEKGMKGAFADASRTVNNSMSAMQSRVVEFTEVVKGFEEQMGGVVEAVAAASAELQAQAESLESAVSSTVEQSTSAAAAAEEASTNVSTVAAATEELTNSVSEINRQVTQSSKTTSAAVEEMEKTSTDIKSLEEASSRIGAVITIIADIAEQTNLLALNATIEAARAGEAGKGFSVVAAEVKGLADQTAKATDEIGGQISAMQRATSHAVEATLNVRDTIAGLNEIASTIAAAVEEQGAATQEIARNIEEAATGTGEVSRSVGIVNETANETSAAAEGVKGASTETARLGDLVRNEVSTFLEAVRKVV